MCCINHDKRKTSMCSQYYLNISSTGAHDPGWEDTHHVESISQFIWNPLKNGKCQSWNSSISSNISRMLSNIKYLLRKGASTNSPRRNQYKEYFYVIPASPCPSKHLSTCIFHATTSSHERHTICRNVPRSLLAFLPPHRLPVLSQSVSEQMIWGQPWALSLLLDPQILCPFQFSSVLELIFPLSLLEFLVTPWGGWTLAWRKHALSPSIVSC